VADVPGVPPAEELAAVPAGELAARLAAARDFADVYVLARRFGKDLLNLAGFLACATRRTTQPPRTVTCGVPKLVSRALTCRSEAVGCSSGTLQAGRAVGVACERGFLSRFIAICRPDGICQLQWATGWRA
jgi:hypothetical protein